MLVKGAYSSHLAVIPVVSTTALAVGAEHRIACVAACRASSRDTDLPTMGRRRTAGVEPCRLSCGRNVRAAQPILPLPQARNGGSQPRCLPHRSLRRGRHGFPMTTN